MGIITAAWAFVEAAGNRLVVQNANKLIGKTGLDNFAARFVKSKPVPTPAVTIALRTFGFLSPFPPTSDITNLYMSLKAYETISLERVTVLFNRTGGNGSYELATYTPPRVLHQGEEIPLTVLHNRKDFAAFWGEENPITQPLKDIDPINWPAHTIRVINFAGPYYCEIVAMHNKGEARKRFTILNPGSVGKLSIVDPLDHQDYDHNRQIPARGMFWS